MLFTSILALIKYFTCQPSQLQGKHESHDKNDQSKGIDQGSQTNIDYLTKEGKHLPWYSMTNILERLTTLALNISFNRYLIGCCNVSPGPHVWLDSCLGAICPGRPNVRVTFVWVRRNVQVDICSGSRWSTCREPSRKCLTYRPSWVMPGMAFWASQDYYGRQEKLS